MRIFFCRDKAREEKLLLPTRTSFGNAQTLFTGNHDDHNYHVFQNYHDLQNYRNYHDYHDFDQCGNEQALFTGNYDHHL